MKVLFVAPWIPSKIRPRSLEILNMLVKDHDVRFVGLVSSEAEEREATELPVTNPVLIRRDRWGSMARCARALPTRTALQQAYAQVPGLSAAVREQIRDWRPDVVHLNVFRTVHLVEECAPTPVIIDLDEFRSEYYEQVARTAKFPWHLVGRIEGPRMKAREDRLVEMGVPIMLSAPDEPGAERPGTYVVRSAYDFPLTRHAEPTEPIVLFVGRLTYEANVHGLMWFIEQCWPGIRTRVPNAKLRIVGTEPPREVLEAATNGVEVFANVPDVDPYYLEASAAIVPIHRGTGVQMKLIQALAAGVPTVATSAVTRRAGVRHGHDVLVSDDPDGWIDAVTTLLTNPEAAQRLAAAGREWAVGSHSTEAVRRQLADAYAAVGPPKDDLFPDSSE